MVVLDVLGKEDGLSFGSIVRCVERHFKRDMYNETYRALKRLRVRGLLICGWEAGFQIGPTSWHIVRKRAEEPSS